MLAGKLILEQMFYIINSYFLVIGIKFGKSVQLFQTN